MALTTGNTKYSFINIILVCLLFYGEKLQAQRIPRGFVLPVEIGQGFRSVQALDHEVYLASIKTHPSYSFLDNKLRVGASFASIYTSRMLVLFSGPRITYKIYSNALEVGELYNIQLTSGIMWGTRGKRLYCFGVTVEPDPIFLSLNGYNEYSEKEFWFEISAGINLDVIFSSDED